MSGTVSRRNFLQVAASAVAAPYVITSTALGNADTPPASDRVTLGHIGVGGRGMDLLRGFLHCKDCAERGRRRRLQETAARAPRPHDQGQGLRRFPRAAGPRRHRRRGGRHARPLARAGRRSPAARAKKDAYVEKPLGVTIEAGSCLPQGVPGARSGSSSTARSSAARSTAASAASWSAAGRSARCKRIEVIAPNGGAGGSTSRNARSARPRLRHVARPGAR